jgi:hypothetical protein
MFALVSHTPASACDVGADLGQANRLCFIPGEAAVDLPHNSDGHTYTIEMECWVKDGECFNPRPCPGPPPGHLYMVYQDGAPFAETCLSRHDATQLGAITPAMVLREMKRLTWPRAELTISPPDHRTLVNLRTIFSTDLEETQSRTVTLLGRSVTIEATPTSWIWHPGDGSESWTTDWPGAAYRPGADVDALNTFTYTDGGVTVQPSVDVVYSGRFHVDGLPGWTGISGTLTVPGNGVDLEVLEAAGTLTGN